MTILLRSSWVALFLATILFPGCSRLEQKSRSLAQAKLEFEAGDYDSAKINYLKVLQSDPTSASAYAHLGQIWLQEGVPLRAVTFLKKAAELSPDDSSNRLQLARACQAVGALVEARKEAFAVLRQAPDNGQALVLLAELARTAEEVSATEQLLQKFPNKETAFYQLANANIALRKKDASAAQEAIEEAVRANPKSPEAHQARGLLQLRQKDQKEALAELKAAAELGPVRSNFQLTYAELLWQTSGAGAATAQLQEVTKKAPDFVAAWTLLSRVAFGAKQYDQALASLQNVFSRDSANVDARLLESDILLARLQPEKAIAVLEKLDQAYPGIPQAKYRLAQAYMQMDKPVQAGSALDQALAKNPDFTDAILARAELSVRTGHATAAINPLEDLINKQPELKAAQFLLADAYRGSGRITDAEKIFREQIKASPEEPESYLFLGLVQVQQDKTDEARKSFERVLELSPDNRLAVEQLTNLDLEAKDYAAASRRTQDQLARRPDSASAYFLDGKVKMAESKWTDAETALKKALELNPNSGAAYDLLVTTYLATQRLPEAAQELETLLSKAPANERTLMTLATIREKQKDYSKAREVYEKLLALDPKFVPALNNLSYLYAEQFNDPTKAYELAQRARNLDSGNPAVADTLGWAAYKRGDYQRALTLFQESASKIGENPEVQFHLGMAFYMMGLAQDARSAFQKAVAGSVDFPGRAEAQTRLALLGDTPDATTPLSAAQLEEMLRRQPNDLLTRLRLAETYERNKDWAKAADAYKTALKINPKLGSAALKLAQIYSGPLPDNEGALSYAKMARSLTPDDPKVTAILGRVAFDTNNFDWSYNLLKDSVRQLGSDPNVLYDLAWAAYSLGKVGEARAAMEKCLLMFPDATRSVEARKFLAVTAMESATTAPVASRAEIDSALNNDPQYVPAIMAVASLDLKQGNKPGVMRCYRQALRRFPDFAPAQKQLALLLAEDPASVVEAYELTSKARKALPDDPIVARLFGRLSYQRKDYARAIQLLEESERKQPLDAAGLYYLGVSRLAANQESAGRQALNQALAQGLEDPLATAAKKALAGSPP